jgi:hypothetical protein
VAYNETMKQLFILFLFIFTSYSTFCQIVPPGWNDGRPATLDGQLIYCVVDIMPKFVGGEEALKRFIQDNISNSLRKPNSKVFIKIIIDKYGFVREPQVLYGKNKMQINESLRIVKKMPRWIPGRNKGKFVYVELPLKFDFEQKK